MPLSDAENVSWGSRHIYLLVLLCQLIGTPMFAILPNVAIIHGTTGYMLCYLICYLAFGIPLLYMEFVISQFTARDCIDVWKIRPCLSHVGYILVLWQVVHVCHNHINVSFTFHYLILSFENPIPYYTCGEWATKECNILRGNYTVNDDCLRRRDPPYYCQNLHTTFPEYQYWKFNMLGMDKRDGTYIAWRVCLASALVCVITYLNLFKRMISLKLVVTFYTLYPVCGYVLLLLGSMIQKGVVVKFEEALDRDLTVFFQEFRFSLIVVQVINNLGMGSGFIFNLGSNTPFRAPCYANTVLVVVACAASSTLAVFTTALMTCPYSYEYGISPFRIIRPNMALIYEKIPRLLYEYQNKFFWLVLTLSSQTILGLSTNIILIFHLLQLASSRLSRVERYSGLTTLFFAILLFCITIPILSYSGTTTMLGLRRFFSLITTLMSGIETLVFVMWYGLDRFSEDVHFMQGTPPRTYLKISWLYSSIVLIYVFFYELYIRYIEFSRVHTDRIGWTIFAITFGLILGIMLIKVLVAATRKRIGDVIRLDPTWGPRNEVLQRSRAMFTAQAMTKEYLYRQYHLQAGILRRKKASNCRKDEESITPQQI